MRTLSVCLSLLLALGALPVWAGEDICATAGWNPDYQKQEITAKCSGAVRGLKACETTREKLLEWNDLYKGMAKDACDKSGESLKNLGELGQSGSQDEVIQKAQTAEGTIDSLLKLNAELLRKIPEASENNIAVLSSLSASRPTVYTQGSPFPVAVNKIKADYETAKTKPDILKTGGANRSSISLDPSDKKEAQAQVFTLEQSQSFVRSLLQDKDQLANARAKLDQQIQKATDAKNRTRTTGNGDNTSGSGFHPMDLLPLAAPLAGLFLQKKNNDSGITDPSSTTPPTTPAPVAGTSFGGGNGSSSTTPGTTTGGTAGTQPNSPDHGIGNPVDTSPIAGSTMDSGNISRGGDGNGKGSGSGFTSSSGSSHLGSSSSAGAGGNTADNARKPAAAKGDTTPGDDGMMGGGGGGLTFNGGGSPGEPSSDANGMQDVLQDMEATLEDSPTGIFAEAENKSGEAEIESPDSLFPRVRACYVRNLKKGNVLNGLGEKLPEGESN